MKNEAKITTIKIYKKTKESLDILRGKRESYDMAIQKLIEERQEKRLRAELEEAYRSLGKEDLEILEEWENASAEVHDQ